MCRVNLGTHNPHVSKALHLLDVPTRLSLATDTIVHGGSAREGPRQHTLTAYTMQHYRDTVQHATPSPHPHNTRNQSANEHCKPAHAEITDEESNK